MKPALLNSIYNKLDSEESLNDLQNLINHYVKKVFVLYLNLLDKVGIKNLDQTILVTNKMPDGYIMKNKFKAGHHMITSLLEGENTKHDIEELDHLFLKHCTCPNAKDILAEIKYGIEDVGSESIDQDEWIERFKGHDNCEDYNFLEEDKE
jgi:hypothetical protein